MAGLAGTLEEASELEGPAPVAVSAEGSSGRDSLDRQGCTPLVGGSEHSGLSSVRFPCILRLRRNYVEKNLNKTLLLDPTHSGYTVEEAAGIAEGSAALGGDNSAFVD